MDPLKDYININRTSWNKKTQVHLDSAFYDMPGFLAGKSSLNRIELDLLGDVSGKSILHLQCHFGQDSISLARMGANVTGIDLSDEAIKNARMLAERLEANAEFICCDLYSLPDHLDRQFDIVFTSYGTIGWLPDLEKWANIVQSYLKPGGKFVFAEFHPLVWMFDDDFQKIVYEYFTGDAIIETVQGSYADRAAKIEDTNISWNHGLAEVVQCLLKEGLILEDLQEYDYSPYDCFDHTIEFAPGKFQIKHLQRKIPMVYSIVASKKGSSTQ